MAPSMNELEAGVYRTALEALAHTDPEKPILQPDAAPADVKEWLEAHGVQDALALEDDGDDVKLLVAVRRELVDYAQEREEVAAPEDDVEAALDKREAVQGAPIQGGQEQQCARQIHAVNLWRQGRRPSLKIRLGVETNTATGSRTTGSTGPLTF